MRDQGPELLAPAGNFECARAAVANGADAIYFGLSSFNARMRADNFTIDQLPELMEFLHAHGVKGYVTFNILVFTGEIDAAIEQLKAIFLAGADAIIVQDMGLATLARKIVPELGLHGSTQMTITSPEGLALVDDAFKLNKAVIARENTIREMHLFHANEPDAVPLETFVHGALCVAYSGQCLTSESLGQRSANRGECAQACRMTYQLIVDDEPKDLGDKKYLLSPQDLAGADMIPQLIEKGVASFKIEGRLKSPDYVAGVTRVYRDAIDAALKQTEPLKRLPISKQDRYQLEMTFSRGLHTGWLDGINNKRLVHARFGKKRGAYVGEITEVGKDWIQLKRLAVDVKRGDGLVVDQGADTDHEQGGRVFDVRDKRIIFQRGKINTMKVRAGDKLWKTDDPSLTRELQKTYQDKQVKEKRSQTGLRLKVSGKADQPLVVSDLDSDAKATSSIDLVVAEKRPLDRELLLKQLGRLGATDFELADVDTDKLDDGLMIPVSQLNQLRRDLVEQLSAEPKEVKARTIENPDFRWQDLITSPKTASIDSPKLHVLCRTEAQIQAVIESDQVQRMYIDLEDMRRYKEVVKQVREDSKDIEIFLATPRIQKAGESGLFKVVERAEPDGVLIRNLGGVQWFTENSKLKRAGDFSLNVANPIAGQFFIDRGLESLTISYDLNINQVLDLLREAPSDWFELTLHQHMPMFHMEHCVFCSFMSEGTDVTNCGRPCDHHEVQLQDRVGQRHPLKADVGCRNTLFNGRAQTGARFFETLKKAGLNAARIELLDEDRYEALETIDIYQDLLENRIKGDDVWQRLKAESRLGVVEGTLA